MGGPNLLHYTRERTVRSEPGARKRPRGPWRRGVPVGMDPVSTVQKLSENLVAVEEGKKLPVKL